MKKMTFAVACIAAVTLSGCASILNDKTQPINVSSSTGNAIAGTIDGVEFTGPGIVNVTRENKDKVLMASTDGCVKETVLPKKVDSKFFINVLAGGVFGSTTDYSTEKMCRYSETVVVACK
jgi:hypothetical protein